MLIYEKKDGETRKLFGTKDANPSANDNEVLVNGVSFDFEKDKYFYMPPGGIMTKNGEEVTVTLNGESIIPAPDAAYDEIDELVDDKGTSDTTDDELIKVFTKDELKAMTKATIFEMASLLEYSSVEMGMSKTEMISAFLAAQEADTRKPDANSNDNSGK